MTKPLSIPARVQTEIDRQCAETGAMWVYFVAVLPTMENWRGLSDAEIAFINDTPDDQVLFPTEG